MLASVGALIPEILDLLGAFHFVEPVWWRVGYSKLKVSTLVSLTMLCTILLINLVSLITQVCAIKCIIILHNPTLNLSIKFQRFKRIDCSF